jgi:hypothetical protein
MALLLAFIMAHSTALVSIFGYVAAQLGNTMPDLGTAEFYKVWGHDFFKAITASNKKK